MILNVLRIRTRCVLPCMQGKKCTAAIILNSHFFNVTNVKISNAPNSSQFDIQLILVDRRARWSSMKETFSQLVLNFWSMSRFNYSHSQVFIYDYRGIWWIWYTEILGEVSRVFCFIQSEIGKKSIRIKISRTWWMVLIIYEPCL